MDQMTAKGELAPRVSAQPARPKVMEPFDLPESQSVKATLQKESPKRGALIDRLRTARGYQIQNDKSLGQETLRLNNLGFGRIIVDVANAQAKQPVFLFETKQDTNTPSVSWGNGSSEQFRLGAAGRVWGSILNLSRYNPDSLEADGIKRGTTYESAINRLTRNYSDPNVPLSMRVAIVGDVEARMVEISDQQVARDQFDLDDIQKLPTYKRFFTDEKGFLKESAAAIEFRNKSDAGSESNGASVVVIPTSPTQKRYFVVPKD